MPEKTTPCKVQILGLAGSDLGPCRDLFALEEFDRINKSISAGCVSMMIRPESFITEGISTKPWQNRSI